MSIAFAKSRIRTVSDLIRSLGVPANRIRMTPLPGKATARDLLRCNERSAILCELVDGVLVEKAVGLRESVIAAILIELIGPFVRAKGLGFLAGADGTLRLRKGLVREPDVAFISWNQVPNRKVPTSAIPDLYPDLAIEVFSRGNRRREMARKRHEYFRAGCRQVWVVYPRTKSIEVYSSPNEFRTFRVGDALDGGEVLPGFKLAVADVFPPAQESNKPEKNRNGKKK